MTSMNDEPKQKYILNSGITTDSPYDLVTSISSAPAKAKAVSVNRERLNWLVSNLPIGIALLLGSLSMYMLVRLTLS